MLIFHQEIHICLRGYTVTWKVMVRKVSKIKLGSPAFTILDQDISPDIKLGLLCT